MAMPVDVCTLLLLLLLATARLWRAALARDTLHNRCPDSCSSCGDFFHCYHNNWTAVPDVLPPLIIEGATRQVVIRNTHLTSLDTSFANASTLMDLNLSRNQLMTIHQDAFVGLRDLISLDLSRNSLQSLDNKPFRDLSSLQRLLLKGNLLTRIQASLFRNLVSLDELDLSGNFLNFIEIGGFRGLGRLRQLSLQNNDFGYPDRRWFEDLVGLSHLYLSSNFIEKLPDFVFRNLQNLTVLELKNCHMKVTGPATFDQLYSLRTLLLSGNRFSHFPVLTPWAMPLLEQVAVGGWFRNIGQEALRDFPRLHTLSVEHCRHLTQIRQGAFVNLQSLQTLNIRNNRHLSRVDPRAFHNVATPREVDFRDNKLRSLAAELFPWGQVDSILLQRNAWICDCSLSWVVDLGLKHLECSSSLGPLSGRRHLDEATISNLTCGGSGYALQEDEETSLNMTGEPPVVYKTNWSLTPYQIGLIVGVILVLIVTLIVTSLVLKDGSPGLNRGSSRGRPIHYAYAEEQKGGNQ